MNKLSLRFGLVGLAVAGAAASQAYDFINLRAPNTGTQMNIVQQGVFSVGVDGSLTSTSVTGGGGSVTNSMLDLRGGYFVTNNIEIVAALTYTGTSGGGGASTNDTFFTIGGRYYFDAAQDKQLLPFVGIFAGFGQDTGTSNLTAYGAELGVDYFLAPTVSFTPAVFFQSLHASGVTANQFGVRFGLTVWFK